VSLAFYFDHHAPAAIADALRLKGIDVLTALDDGAAEFADDAILERATGLGRLVFTQDEDFLAIAHAWAAVGRDFAGVVYGHQLRVTIGQAIRDLELIAQIMEPEEMRNRVEFLPLR
jgi:hypothetical protein